MRGEQTIKQGQQARREGSPPLARGTAYFSASAISSQRITPACAGNSFMAFSFSFLFWDHPRLRGEQLNLYNILPPRLGSPPLARGTGAHLAYFSASARITPACAGNSGCSADVTPGRWDHPRLRGEQFADCITVILVPGSPPLARGTASRCAVTLIGVGITPRLRGEQAAKGGQETMSGGSPPLARGTD